MSASSALDVSSSDKKLWLVKLPPMVAQRLHAMAAQGGNNDDPAGQPIGRVRVTHNTTQVPDLVCCHMFACNQFKLLRHSQHLKLHCCVLQTSSDFRLDLDPANFPSIPKEFNMRPHADGVQDAYCFNRHCSGNIGASEMVEHKALLQHLQAAHAEGARFYER
jgi:TFIIF, beta subunit N-terminus